MTDQRSAIVAGGVLVQFTVIGFLFAFSIFFKSIEEELGWSRTLISAGASLATLTMGALAIVGGRLSDRLGPRIVLIGSSVTFAAGIALLSVMQEPWQYLVIYGLFIGIGLATHDVVTLSTVARWFEARRGIMTGVVKLGTAAGQAVYPPLTALLVVWLGWRAGLLSLSAVSLVVLILASLMMRLPDVPKSGGPAPEAPGLSFAEARRSPIFWTLCMMQLLFFPTLMTVPLHLPVHGQDLGMTAQNAAFLITIFGLSSVVGRLALGVVADRLGGKNAYAIAIGGLVISLAGYALTGNPSGLLPLAALYGFSHGALFVIVSPTVARYFGMRAHGAIFGTVLFFGMLGGAAGPVLAGWVFDSWGSYTPAFWALCAAAGLALILSLTLPKPAEMGHFGAE
jgi:MFS family permease